MKKVPINRIYKNYNTISGQSEKYIESLINREDTERKKAVIREAKFESIEFKTGLAQRKCVQQLLKPEQAWEKACKAKVQDSEKIEEARLDILRTLDNAAADSIGRMMAEIKQKYLASQNGEETLQEVELPVEDFYEGFKKFCKQNFVGYTISEQEFDEILANYTKLNLGRIKVLGEKVGYEKPAKKFVENAKILKKVAVKEKELSL